MKNAYNTTPDTCYFSIKKNIIIFLIFFFWTDLDRPPSKFFVVGSWIDRL
jgi:hypothetical protein